MTTFIKNSECYTDMTKINYRRDAMIKNLTIPLVVLLLSFNVSAQCIGGNTYSSCYDDNGNEYEVYRYGSTTEVHGRNLSTGSEWSQESNTYGNITETNGIAANGNEWNSTRTDLGNGNYTLDGTDSNGDSFYYLCDNYGCN